MWKQNEANMLGTFTVVSDSEVIVYYGAVLKNAATKPLSGSSDFSTGWLVCVFCLLGLVMLDRW